MNRTVFLFLSLSVAAAARATAENAISEEKAGGSGASSHEPAAQSADHLPAVAAPSGSDILMLPKVEVTKSRLKEIDREIRRIDKQITREKARMRAGELDNALNNEKLAAAAGLFGGNSASHMALVAAQRVGLLETERGLLADMKSPRTLEEMKLLERELVRLREIRRELDNPRR